MKTARFIVCSILLQKKEHSHKKDCGAKDWLYTCMNAKGKSGTSKYPLQCNSNNKFNNNKTQHRHRQKKSLFQTAIACCSSNTNTQIHMNDNATRTKSFPHHYFILFVIFFLTLFVYPCFILLCVITIILCVCVTSLHCNWTRWTLCCIPSLSLFLLLQVKVMFFALLLNEKKKFYVLCVEPTINDYGAVLK